MKLVQVSQLENGDVLGKPVVGRNGVIMLEAGTVLTDQYIHRLRGLGVTYVSLRVHRGVYTTLQEEPGARFLRKPDLGGAESSPDWEVPDIDRMKNDDKARKEAVRLVEQYVESASGLDRISIPVPHDDFLKQFRDRMLTIVSERSFAEELGVLMLSDRLLFEHALHVTLCADVVGFAKRYDSSSQYELSLGALFSDIGMTRLPVDLLKMSRELKESERAIMRRHTTEGYRILSRMKEMPESAAKVALYHHERYRGEGYPFGKKHDDIPEFARIVGMADVYNALLSPRHHRQPYSQHEATEYLFASGNYEFDVSLIKTFLRYLSVYSVSSVVLLSSGQTAVVVNTANRPFQRPIVQIIREADGSSAASPYLLDLEEHTSLFILRSLST